MGSEKELLALIAAGVSPRKKDEKGATPLVYSMAADQKPIKKLPLNNYDAKPGSDDEDEMCSLDISNEWELHEEGLPMDSRQNRNVCFFFIRWIHAGLLKRCSDSECA